jgi:hypothetical protein
MSRSYISSPSKRLHGLLWDSFSFFSLRFFLPSPNSTEQWLAYHWWYAYHSLRNSDLKDLTVNDCRVCALFIVCRNLCVVICVITPRRLISRYQRFGKNLLSTLALKMETVCFSQSLVSTYKLLVLQPRRPTSVFSPP